MHSPARSRNSIMSKPSTRKTTRRNRSNRTQAILRGQQEAPASIGYSLTPSEFVTTHLGNGRIRVTGHEVVGIVALATFASAPTDQIALVVDANPACWRDSRLSLVARAYERYRYNSCVVQYVPSCSTGTTGSIATMIETDPSEPLPRGTNAVTRMLNTSYSALCPAWASSSFKFERNKEDKQWFLASQAGEASREQVTQFVAAAFFSGTTTGGQFGRLVFHYDIEFIYPELEFIDGGEQFRDAAYTFNAGAIDTVVEVTPSPAPPANSKILELRNVSRDMPSMYTVSRGNWFDAIAGAALYAAFNGVAWNVYPTLEAAKTLSNPLRWTDAQGVGLLVTTFVRTLIASLNVR
nr:structural protein [Tolivirales sp.]